MTAFAQFVRNTREDSASPILAGGAGCLTLVALLALIATGIPAALIFFAFAGMLLLARQRSNRKRLRQLPPEIQQTLQELQPFADEHFFELRFNPRLFAALEDITETLCELQSLRSRASAERAKLLLSGQIAAQEGLLEAMWLGRRMIYRGFVRSVTSLEELWATRKPCPIALNEVEKIREDVEEMRLLLLKGPRVTRRPSALETTLSELREHDRAADELLTPAQTNRLP